MNLKKIFDSSRGKVGDFVKTYESGLKNDGGFANGVWDCMKYGVSPRKGKIEKVINATMQEVLDGSYESRCGEGGSASDSVEEQKWNYTQDELSTFYDLLTLVNITDRPNAYFYTDRQGFDYVRYLHFPEGWEEMFADIIEEEDKKFKKWEAYGKAEDDAIMQRSWEIYNDIVSQFNGVLVKGGEFAKNMRALVKYYEGPVKFKFSKYRHYGYTLEFEDDAVAQDFYDNIKDLENALHTLYLAPSEPSEDGYGIKSTDGVTQFYNDYDINLTGYAYGDHGWELSYKHNIQKDKMYWDADKRKQKAYDKYGHENFREQWKNEHPFESFQVPDSRRRLRRRW